MDDEPTTGELWRRIDDMRAELRTGMSGISERLDKVPTTELVMAHLAAWEAHLSALREDVAENQRAITAERDQRQSEQQRLTNRLWWIAGSVLIPVALVIASIVFNTGAGSGGGLP